MNKPPAFQFYARDFLVSTMTLSAAEVGAYIRLLAWSWDNGPLPNNRTKIAQISGAEIAIWDAISHKWKASKRGFTNVRLERERAKQTSFRELQTHRAKKRWHKTADAVAMPRHASGNAEPMLCDLRSASASSSADLKKEQERARETTAVAVVRDPEGRALAEGGAWKTGTRLSPLVRNHPACFHAPEACARGWCIPKFLGEPWVDQIGRDAVLDFVRLTLAHSPPGAIGDQLKFWRDRWDAAHARPTQQRAVTKGSTTFEAARRVAARLAAREET